MEELFSDANIILMGFVFWLSVAPGIFRSRQEMRFPAYVAALMICMTVTSDLGLRLPTAFFFSVGCGLAFCFLLLRIVFSSVYLIWKNE